MTPSSQGWMFMGWVLMGLVGCAGHPTSGDSEQAHLGRGIVEGTKGYQQLQEELFMMPAGTLSVEGQVIQIEGGAYVIRDGMGVEVRLPLDENTRIDRPAHVGDWIKAYLDEGARAVFIRNVNGRISLE